MSSADRDGGQAKSRRNTFQRMLDMERKNKVNLLQVSMAEIPSARISIDRYRDSIPCSDHCSASLQSTGRAFTAPTLSVSIPPIEPSSHFPTVASSLQAANDAWKPGGIYFEGGEDVSDVSSICQSPGWGDHDTKKIKKERKEAKERRRKEKAKAATEAKYAQKLMNRLTKAPPTNKKLEKMVFSMERSSSAPAVQTIPEVRNSKCSSQKNENHSRRGSLEIGLKNFLHATPIPWRPAQPAYNQEPQSSVYNGEFIGGLKLKLINEARIQEGIGDQNSTISSYHSAQETPVRESQSPAEKSIVQERVRSRRSTISMDHPGRRAGPISDNAIDLNPSQGENYDHSTQYEGPNTVPMEAPSDQSWRGERSAQQWESIYNQAAKMAIAANTSLQATVTLTPIIDRTIEIAHKNTVPVSSTSTRGSQFTEHTEANGQSGLGVNKSFDPASSPPVSHEDKINQTPNMTTAVSPERSCFTGQEASKDRPRTAEPSRGRLRASSYVRAQRQQSRDRSVAGFEDEYLVSTVNSVVSIRPRSGGRLFSYNSTRNHRRSSSEATSTIWPTSSGSIGKNSSEESGQNDISFNKNPPQPGFNQQPPAPLRSENPLSIRKPSNTTPILPVFRCLRSAAKTAFSRPSSSVTSPTSLFYQNNVQNLKQSQPGVSKPASTIGTVDGCEGPFGKADRALGASVLTLQQDFDKARPHNLGKTSRTISPNGLSTPEQVRGGNAVPSNQNRKSKVENSHSRSITDSSEEYSTLDESSYNTTPPASRPHSQIDSLHPAREANLKTTRAKNANKSITKYYSRNEKTTSTTNHGVPYTNAANKNLERLSGADLPLKPKSVERKRATNGKNYSTTQLPGVVDSTGQSITSSKNSNANVSDLQRQPSISRSISTPDLQDLSFLPPLKHQSLRKGKGKESFVAEDKAPKSVIKPPTPQINEPEGSSSVSPAASSQYLRDARLNVPILRAPGNSPVKSPAPGPEIQPLAKMFVICCSCRYFHDLPSKIYECMAKPNNVVTDTNLGVSGVISTAVKCPWCGHGMSTSCCEGYAAVVYLREKLH